MYMLTMTRQLLGLFRFCNSCVLNNKSFLMKRLVPFCLIVVLVTILSCRKDMSFDNFSSSKSNSLISATSVNCTGISITYTAQITRIPSQKVFVNGKWQNTLPKLRFVYYTHCTPSVLKYFEVINDLEDVPILATHVDIEVCHFCGDPCLFRQSCPSGESLTRVCCAR